MSVTDEQKQAITKVINDSMEPMAEFVATLGAEAFAAGYNTCIKEHGLEAPELSPKPEES